MSIKILLIEDDKQLQENIKIILEMHKYICITTESGMDGVEIAEREYPDLIICDVMLKEMDGFAVLEKIRSRNSLLHTPFLFLTARADAPDKRKGMNLGADDYITKPFRTQDLLECIKSRLSFKQKKDTERVQAITKNTVQLFLNISEHEFFTPLNGIINLSETLNDLLPGEMEKKLANSISLSAYRMLRTSKKIKCYALLNQMPHNIWSTDTKDKLKISESFDIALKKINATKYSGKIDIDVTVPYINKYDAPTLEFIFIELFDNIIMYADKSMNPKVEVTQNNGHTIFVFENHYEADYSFTHKDVIPFYQPYNNKSSNGLGLSLYIIKKFVEMQNGSIQITAKDHTFKLIMGLPVK